MKSNAQVYCRSIEARLNTATRRISRLFWSLISMEAHWPIFNSSLRVWRRTYSNWKTSHQLFSRFKRHRQHHRLLTRHRRKKYQTQVPKRVTWWSLFKKRSLCRQLCKMLGSWTHWFSRVLKNLLVLSKWKLRPNCWAVQHCNTTGHHHSSPSMSSGNALTSSRAGKVTDYMLSTRKHYKLVTWRKRVASQFSALTSIKTYCLPGVSMDTFTFLMEEGRLTVKKANS